MISYPRNYRLRVDACGDCNECRVSEIALKRSPRTEETAWMPSKFTVAHFYRRSFRRGLRADRAADTIARSVGSYQITRGALIAPRRTLNSFPCPFRVADAEISHQTLPASRRSPGRTGAPRVAEADRFADDTPPFKCLSTHLRSSLLPRSLHPPNDSVDYILSLSLFLSLSFRENGVSNVCVRLSARAAFSDYFLSFMRD